MKLKVFISGQKYFAEQVYRLCIRLGFDVVGVCCPLDDKYIGKAAAEWGTPIIAAGTLNGDRYSERRHVPGRRGPRYYRSQFRLCRKAHQV